MVPHQPTNRSCRSRKPFSPIESAYESVSIGVIGAGLFGRKHIDTMLSESEPICKLVAIADSTPEAAAYAQTLGVPCFGSYVEMLDQVRPEAAIIAAPNVLHVPARLGCAERGVQMLVEKPIAETVEAATQLSEAAERAGVALLVEHHRRHNAIIEKAPNYRAASSRRFIEWRSVASVEYSDPTRLINIGGDPNGQPHGQ